MARKTTIPKAALDERKKVVDVINKKVIDDLKKDAGLDTQWPGREERPEIRPDKPWANVGPIPSPSGR